jgi:hypothetical protein
VPNDTCELHIFTWAYVTPDVGGTPVLTPVCPYHPRSRVFLRALGGRITILCQEGVEHVVGNCTLEDFEAEKLEAEAALARRGG